MYERGYSQVARFIVMYILSGTKPNPTRRANERRTSKLTGVNGVVVLRALLDDIVVYAVVAGSVAQPYPLWEAGRYVQSYRAHEANTYFGALEYNRIITASE